MYKNKITMILFDLGDLYNLIDLNPVTKQAVRMIRTDGAQPDIN